MAKTTKGFRLSDSTLQQMEEIKILKNWNATTVIEVAVNRYHLILQQEKEKRNDNA